MSSFFIIIVLISSVSVQLRILSASPVFSLSLNLSLSHILSLPIFIFSFFGFPGIYMGTIDVQLMWARHERASERLMFQWSGLLSQGFTLRLPSF